MQTFMLFVISDNGLRRDTRAGGIYQFTVQRTWRSCSHDQEEAEVWKYAHATSSYICKKVDLHLKIASDALRQIMKALIENAGERVNFQSPSMLDDLAAAANVHRRELPGPNTCRTLEDHGRRPTNGPCCQKDVDVDAERLPCVVR